MSYEYKMSKATAMDLLKNRKGDEKKLDNQKYLCNYVNQTYGLLYVCTKVIIE